MITEITVDELYPRWLTAREKGAPCTIIDVRTPEEYAEAHVPSARLIALNTLMARAHELPSEGEVYLICHSGARSAQAAAFLMRQFRHINPVNVAGGMLAWIRAGYPIEKGDQT